MTTVVELQQEIEALEKKLAPLFIQQGKINSQIQKLHKKKAVLSDQKSELEIAFLAANPSDDEIAFCIEEVDTMPRYKHAQKFFSSMGFNMSGYHTDTMQRGLSVMMTHGSKESYDKTLESVKKVLPYLKEGGADPLTEKCKRFGVFEHTLSEHGVYHLAINEEKNIYTIIIHRYHRASIHKETKSLEELLKYVQDNLWYDGGHEELGDEDPWD